VAKQCEENLPAKRENQCKVLIADHSFALAERAEISAASLIPALPGPAEKGEP
jgi:hypothetical protein